MMKNKNVIYNSQTDGSLELPFIHVQIKASILNELHLHFLSLSHMLTYPYISKLNYLLLHYINENKCFPDTCVLHLITKSVVYITHLKLPLSWGQFPSIYSSVYCMHVTQTYRRQ